MPINPFKLERYFAKYEFKVKYLLSSSDCESLALAELLQMARPQSSLLWQELKLGYTESPGHPLLRAEVAGLYRDTSPDQVLIATPEEAIFIVMQTMLSAGDHVIAVSPAYQSLYEIARSLGCDVTPWKLEPRPGGWQLDLNQLESSLTDQTRMLVLNFPNNPTGFTLSPIMLESVINLARAHHLIVFSDEMYRLLEWDNTLRLPSICECYEQGIALSGLSKAFALPGLRVGWLVTQEPHWIERFLAYKDYTTICNSAPSEILALIALQNSSRIISRNLEIIQNNLALAGQFFTRHHDRFNWLPPQAGSVAFPQWLSPDPVERFCQELLDHLGIMIVPGSLFDRPGNHFRIGLGRRNFQEALDHLDQYLG